MGNGGQAQVFKSKVESAQSWQTQVLDLYIHICSYFFVGFTSGLAHAYYSFMSDLFAADDELSHLAVLAALFQFGLNYAVEKRVDVEVLQVEFLFFVKF